MWDRKELKARGKAAFKANYWRCVGAAVILMITAGAGGIASGRAGGSNPELVEQLKSMNPEHAFVVVAVVLGIIGFVMLVCTVLSIFVFRPLEVGGRRFFLENSDEPADMDELTWGFRNDYMHTVGVMFVRDVYLLLWCCLLVVPGLVKSYAYRMVPYIVAEHPELSANEAITLSRKMMNGHKMNSFILDLSFLGWIILSALTAGLVGVFYYNPYLAATDAELYKALRENV